jgi:hypothetical protein
MRNLAALACTLLAAACACGLDAPPPAPVASACDDGTRLLADYDPLAHMVTVARQGAPPLPMTRTISGSGERFRNGDFVFHAKGPRAMWITGGNRVVGCREVRPGQASGRPQSPTANRGVLSPG